MQLGLAGELGSHCCPPCACTASAEPPPHAGDKGAALPSQAQATEPQPVFIHPTPQRWANRTARPNTSFPQQQEKPQLKASGCRQQPWYRFIQHKLSSFGGERGLAALPTHSRLPGAPPSTRAARSPCWPPLCSHHTSHPCSRRDPPALPRQPPAPRGGSRHRQGWHHAGCTAAREFAGSRGKSQATAAAETWQEGWTGAAEAGRGCSHPPSALSS